MITRPGSVITDVILLRNALSITVERKTRYINSDLVISSPNPIADLCKVLDETCCVLYQQQGDDGNWYATIEADTIHNVSASDDIRKMLTAVSRLSGDARKQWNDCPSREINVGFDCGDTWAYPHNIENDVLRMIADADCRFALTLYPIREDGKEPNVDAG